MEKDNDLISRSALVEAFRARKMTDAVPNYDRASSEVKAAIGKYAELTKALVFVAPAVDAIPARHGCWEADVWSYPEKRVIKTVPITEENLRKYAFRKPFDIRLTHERCSVCKEGPLASFNEEYEFSEYCPNCGAKMDAEVQDG